MTYQDAVKELEKILKEIESPNLDVDAVSVRAVRAAELIRFCREKVNATKAEVTAITAALQDEAHTS